MSLPPLPHGAPSYLPSTASATRQGNEYVSQFELNSVQADAATQGNDGMQEKAARRRNQSSQQPTPAHLDNLAKEYQQTLILHYYHYALRGIVAPIVQGNLRQLQARTEGIRLAKQQLSISTTTTTRPNLPPLPTAPQSRTPIVPPSNTVLLRSTSLITSPSSSHIPLPSLPASPSVNGLGRSNSAALPNTTSYSTFGQGQLPSPVGTTTTTTTTTNRFDLRRPIPLPTPPSPSKPTLPTPPSPAPTSTTTTTTTTTTEPDRKQAMENLLNQKLAQLELLNSDSDSDNESVEDLLPTMSAPAMVVVDGGGGGIPSFNFGNVDEESSLIKFDRGDELGEEVREGGNGYGASTSYKLHPRNDPSHPSHPLYQPTSTSTTTSRHLSHLHSKSTAIPTTTTSTSLQICHSCSLPIIGRTWLALGTSFHPGCFKCSYVGCGIGLEFIEFGEAEDLGWCMVHYEEVRPLLPPSFIVLY